MIYMGFLWDLYRVYMFFFDFIWEFYGIYAVLMGCMLF